MICPDALVTVSRLANISCNEAACAPDPRHKQVRPRARVRAQFAPGGVNGTSPEFKLARGLMVWNIAQLKAFVYRTLPGRERFPSISFANAANCLF